MQRTLNGTFYGMMKMLTLMNHFILSLTSLVFDLLASVIQESPGLREQLIKSGDIKIVEYLFSS